MVNEKGSNDSVEKDHKPLFVFAGGKVGRGSTVGAGRDGRGLSGAVMGGMGGLSGLSGSVSDTSDTSRGGSIGRLPLPFPLPLPLPRSLWLRLSTAGGDSAQSSDNPKGHNEGIERLEGFPSAS